MGPDAGLLTVSGNNTLRVFNIAPVVTVTIDSLTIANGKASLGSFGGGIYNQGMLAVSFSCSLTRSSPKKAMLTHLRARDALPDNQLLWAGLINECPKSTYVCFWIKGDHRKR